MCKCKIVAISRNFLCTKICTTRKILIQYTLLCVSSYQFVYYYTIACSYVRGCVLVSWCMTVWCCRGVWSGSPAPTYRTWWAPSSTPALTPAICPNTPSNSHSNSDPLLVWRENMANTCYTTSVTFLLCADKTKLL